MPPLLFFSKKVLPVALLVFLYTSDNNKRLLTVLLNTSTSLQNSKSLLTTFFYLKVNLSLSLPLKWLFYDFYPLQIFKLCFSLYFFSLLSLLFSHMPIIKKRWWSPYMCPFLMVMIYICCRFQNVNFSCYQSHISLSGTDLFLKLLEFDYIPC